MQENPSNIVELRSRLAARQAPSDAPQQATDVTEEQDLQEWKSHSVRFLVRRSIQDLPAPPAVLMRILHCSEQEDASAAELEKMIATDQALSAKVLRVVNSAYYGLSGRVSSLSQAIVIVGMQQVRNLALSIASLSMIKATTSRQRALHQRFWRQSLGSAIGAQELARKKQMPAKAIEEAYVGGLLHDIGRLFLFTNFTDTHLDVASRAECDGRPLHEVELETFGVTHMEVGEELALNWNFPPHLTACIRDHHGPFDAATAPGLLAIHLADLAAELAFEEQPPSTHMDPAAAHWADFDDESLAKFAQVVKEKVEACEGVVMSEAA